MSATSSATVLSGADLSRVRAVLYLNGLRGDEIDDGAQDVALRLIERAPEQLLAPGAWACTVAARVALDRVRRTSSRRRLLGRLASRVREVSAAPDLDVVLAVRAALAQLPPKLRSVLVLRYFADFDVASIAVALDLPEGTVKSRLHRAAGRLRLALAEEES